MYVCVSGGFSLRKFHLNLKGFVTSRQSVLVNYENAEAYPVSQNICGFITLIHTFFS